MRKVLLCVFALCFLHFLLFLLFASHYFSLFSLYRQADKSLLHHQQHHHDYYNDPWACNEICWGTWLSSLHSPRSPHSPPQQALLSLLPTQVSGNAVLCLFLFFCEKAISMDSCVVPHITRNHIYVYFAMGNYAKLSWFFYRFFRK